MSDLIKREDVIKAVWDEDINPSDDGMVFEAQSHIDRDIRLISSAERKGEWIPCEERLPKARESVLLAVNSKYGDWVGEGCYWETTENHIIWKGYRWNATYWDDEIIAWMPLPQPYREVGE